MPSGVSLGRARLMRFDGVAPYVAELTEDASARLPRRLHVRARSAEPQRESR